MELSLEALPPIASEFTKKHDKVWELQLWSWRVCVVDGYKEVLDNRSNKKCWPEKIQRDADFRFVKVNQNHNESVTTFYKHYLQEVNAWTDAWNSFIDAEIIMEGHGEDTSINEPNPRARDIRACILVKYEKKKAMNLLTKLDRNCFTSLLDELANNFVKWKITIQTVSWMLCNLLRPIDQTVASLVIWSVVPRMWTS